MKNKNKTIILSFILLIILSFLFIGIGIYFSYLSKPKVIMGKIIDQIDYKIDSIWNSYNDYYLGDNFTLDSTFKMTLGSEKLSQNSITDIESSKKYQLLKNINQLENHLIIMRNKDTKQALISFNQNLKEENILNARYVIDNSTEYYFVNQILNQYINNGSCNYFETLSNSNQATDNIKYIYSSIIQSLKNNIKEEYFKEINNQTIDGYSGKVNQISLKITDKIIKNILNDIIKDLKKDKHSNEILTGIIKDFSKVKVNDKTSFLDKNESYTINIYTTSYMKRPLKYEIVYLNGDNKSSLSFEGEGSSKDIYYAYNDIVKYHIKSNFTNNLIELTFFDSKEKEIGQLKYEKDDFKIILDYSFDNTKDKYTLTYSSKLSDKKNGKSYIKNTDITYKHTHNKVGVIDGKIEIETSVKNQAKIDEDLSNAVLSSTLTEEKKQQFKTISSNILERLER